MLTYAIDDKYSFEAIEMWMKEFLYYADVKEDVQFPFVVIGNKVRYFLMRFLVNCRDHQRNVVCIVVCLATEI